MTNLSGISLICVAADGIGGAPTTIGAPVSAANSANALVLTSLNPNLIASMIGPRGISGEIVPLASLCILFKQFCDRF
jgi:hypothetical protein